MSLRNGSRPRAYLSEVSLSLRKRMGTDTSSANTQNSEGSTTHKIEFDLLLGSSQAWRLCVDRFADIDGPMPLPKKIHVYLFTVLTMKQRTRWAGIYLRIQAIKSNKLLHSGSSAYLRKDNKVCGDPFGEPIAQSKISELPGKSIGFCLERKENNMLASRRAYCCGVY